MLTVIFTELGDLHLSADLAQAHFPNDVLVPIVRGGELWLMPTRGAAAGGLLLKRRNRAGDRSTLIWESLQQAGASPQEVAGPRPAFWDAERGALRVALRGTLS